MNNIDRMNFRNLAATNPLVVAKLAEVKKARAVSAAASEARDKFFSDASRASHSKKFHTCRKCGSKVAMNAPRGGHVYAKNHRDCPVCYDRDFVFASKAQAKQAEALEKAAADADVEVRTLTQQLILLESEIAKRLQANARKAAKDQMDALLGTTKPTKRRKQPQAVSA